MATLRVNASTVKRAQDARKLVIRMNLARRLLKCVNCGECHAAYNKKCSVYKRSMTFNQSGCPEIFPFLKLDKFIKGLMDRG